jgi:hypothetical protein
VERVDRGSAAPNASITRVCDDMVLACGKSALPLPLFNFDAIAVGLAL